MFGSSAGRVGVVGCSLLLALWIPATVTAQGDTCADATPIGVGSFGFTTFGANSSFDSPADPELGADVWFQFTATQVGTVRFETCGAVGALEDTIIVIYDARIGPGQ